MSSVLIFPLKRLDWGNESELQRKEADGCLLQFFIPAITTTTTRDWPSWGCHAYFASIANTSQVLRIRSSQFQEYWNAPSGETLGMKNEKRN